MGTELNKRYNKLIFLGIFMYFSLMFAKQIFNAEIIAIQEVFHTNATKTSLVTLIYYVVYAISQMFLVLFIDKINLRVYLGVSLGISAMLTILIGFVEKFGAELPFLFIVFGLNGVLQAGNYAGIVRIFNKYLNREKYMLAMKMISIAATVSLASSYAITSLFVAFSRWDIPFVITGALFAFSVALFVFGLKPTINDIKSLGHVEKEAPIKVENQEKVIRSKATVFSVIAFMVLVCIIGLFANFLYYGLNNWFSKLIYDVYGVPKHYSILVSVGVSLLTAIACTMAISYYNKSNKGHIVTVIGFAVLFVIAIIMSFTYEINVVYAIFMCLAFICVIQGIKTPYTSVITYEVRDVIEPAKYSLVFNAMASISAGCSPTAISLVFENYGWSTSFITLAIVALIMSVVVLAVRFFQVKMMRSFYEDKNQFNNSKIIGEV